MTDVLNKLAKHIHECAVDKGWWEEDGTHVANTKLLLMVTEIAEAVEWLRLKPGAGIAKSNHIPDFLGIEEELADVIIRVLDFAHHYNYDIGGALTAKMIFNEERPHKHGGKKF